MNREHLYSTTDIQVATVLMCIGHHLEDVGRKGQFGRKAQAVFYFQDSEKLHSDMVAYNNDEIELSPRQLFSRFRELKSQACNI